MSALKSFADWFKTRRTKIERYYADDVGKFAFRVTVDGQRFVCAARTSSPSNGRTSVMSKVAGRAQTEDALILLRLPDGMFVFDPVTVLDKGNTDDAHDDDRTKRGEKWVYFDVDLGCGFEEWYDGAASPVRYGDALADY